MELSFIKGYSVLDLTKRKGDFGIALLIRDGVHFEKRPKSCLFSLQDIEAISASVLGTSGKRISIASVYVHQDCSFLYVLFKTVTLEQLAWFGDFNCRGYFKFSEMDNQTGVVVDSLLLQQEAGHLQVVLPPEPTFLKVERSSVYGAILDIELILSGFPEVFKVEVLQELDSDNLPVLASVNFPFNLFREKQVL
jgi:hypothetical protein